MVAALLLGAAGELGADQHRHPQLLGHDLQVPGDVRHLGDPVLGLFGRLHQLEVVHDDEVRQRVHPPEPRLDVRHRDGGGVVYVNGQGAEDLRPLPDPRPFVGGEGARPQLFEGYTGLRGEEAVDQLLPGHFEVEHGHGLALARHVAGQVQGEAGLPHAGAGAHDDEIGAVQAAGVFVEGADAAGDPRDGGPLGRIRQLA